MLNLDVVASTLRPIGMSPSGKATGFGPVIRRFDPCHPSQNKNESLLSFFYFERMDRSSTPAIPATKRKLAFFFLCYNHSMETVIEAKNLSKTYGKKSLAFTALKDISLDIKKGESVAIVGKSGSGKSTLMHLLALLDKPTKGSVYINGENSTKLRARALNQLRNQSFGFVFQQFFMNPNDSVLDNVLLPLKIAKISPFKRKKLAMEALKTVDLESKAQNKANDLSGGQKQRVCIARAIVNNPDIIFADEPTGNLDSATGDKITDLLFELNQKQGVTLIIVTHDEDLAKLCSRIVRIADGKIISDSAVRKDLQTKASEKREKEAARVRRANETKKGNR